MPAQVRARHPQMLLAVLAEREPAAHGKVMAALGCAELLSQALPVQWLPVEVDIEVIEVVTRALPVAAFESLISERQRREFGSALFKSFITTTTKLFGLSPATFVRHLGRGWSQMLQECGVIKVVSIEKQSALVTLSELPPVCLASAAWIGALPAGLRVLYELVHTRGEVTVTTRDDVVELRFNW